MKHLGTVDLSEAVTTLENLQDVFCPNEVVDLFLSQPLRKACVLYIWLYQKVEPSWSYIPILGLLATTAKLD